MRPAPCTGRIHNGPTAPVLSVRAEPAAQPDCRADHRQGITTKRTRPHRMIDLPAEEARTITPERQTRPRRTGSAAANSSETPTPATTPPLRHPLGGTGPAVRG